MNVSYAMNVLNGEPFIWYQLHSIYEFAHEIIIVEGAYDKFRHAANGFRSKDKTIEIIEQFPDPCKKIKLIKKNYFYDDRVGMCNEFMNQLTGDILWQIDVDEFYARTTHDYVKHLFESDDLLDQISFNFFDYYRGFEHIISGYASSLIDVVRVHRIYPGLMWSSQRPPTLALNGKIFKPRKSLNGQQMRAHGHFMHNATMIFDGQVADKFTYYSKMWPKGIQEFNNWYISSWMNFEQKFSVAGLKDSLTYVLPRKHTLPETLLLMQSDIYNGNLSGYQLNSKLVQMRIDEDLNYSTKVSIANLINEIESLPLLSLGPRYLRIFTNLCRIPPCADKSLIIAVFLRRALIRPIKILIQTLNL